MLFQHRIGRLHGGICISTHTLRPAAQRDPERWPHACNCLQLCGLQAAQRLFQCSPAKSGFPHSRYDKIANRGKRGLLYERSSGSSPHLSPPIRKDVVGLMAVCKPHRNRQESWKLSDMHKNQNLQMPTLGPGSTLHPAGRHPSGPTVKFSTASIARLAIALANLNRCEQASVHVRCALLEAAAENLLPVRKARACADPPRPVSLTGAHHKAKAGLLRPRLPVSLCFPTLAIEWGMSSFGHGVIKMKMCTS